MSKLLVHPKESGPIFAEVKAEEAGWDFLNMAAIRLLKGEIYSTDVKENEHVSVLLGGRAKFTVTEANGHKSEHTLGRRPDVFHGMPHALYLPRRSSVTIEALSDELEIASCWVPTDQDHPVQAITPAVCPIEIRGGGNASRQINGIIPPGFDCHRLICVEVYTPSGHWSSYPPHKHDVHSEDESGKVTEADLEEIYFYKISHPTGFAYQRVYTGDGGLDELCMARNNDAVLVPEGYHPVVSGHGYTTYYLNFLAGSAQSLANSDDPHHTWVKENWGPPHPSLPIVHHGMETYVAPEGESAPQS